VKQREAQGTSSQEEAILDARIRGVGIQTGGLLEELKSLAGSVSERPPVPRRLDPVYRSRSVSHDADRLVLPSRFLRRRYRELLGRVPILTYVPGKPVIDSEGPPVGQYKVSLAANALSRRVQHETTHSQELDAVDLAWFERGNKRL
jgi:hypothetical protein